MYIYDKRVYFFVPIRWLILLFLLPSSYYVFVTVIVISIVIITIHSSPALPSLLIKWHLPVIRITVIKPSFLLKKLSLKTICFCKQLNAAVLSVKSHATVFQGSRLQIVGSFVKPSLLLGIVLLGIRNHHFLLLGIWGSF